MELLIFLAVSCDNIKSRASCLCKARPRVGMNDSKLQDIIVIIYETEKARKIIKMTLDEENSSGSGQTGPDTYIPHISQLVRIEWMEIRYFFSAREAKAKAREEENSHPTKLLLLEFAWGARNKELSLRVEGDSMMFRELRLIELYMFALCERARVRILTREFIV